MPEPICAAADMQITDNNNTVRTTVLFIIYIPRDVGRGLGLSSVFDGLCSCAGGGGGGGDSCGFASVPASDEPDDGGCCCTGAPVGLSVLIVFPNMGADSLADDVVGLGSFAAAPGEMPRPTGPGRSSRLMPALPPPLLPVPVFAGGYVWP